MIVDPLVRLSPDFWAMVQRWVLQAMLMVLGAAVLRYLKQIRDSLRRSIWQGDIMWAVFCIERDIPLTSTKYVGTERGKEIAIEIISGARKKKKENGSAHAAAGGGIH